MLKRVQHDTLELMEHEVKEAIEILNKGGIIIFPTDTAFGIGCRVDDEKAVERLFNIRKRPVAQAAPVLVDTVKMAQNYLQPIPREVIDELIEPFWPGALTIVLQSRIDKVPELVRGGGTTMGVRIPNHPVARAIIRGVGAGILGPSANFHGEKTPFKFEELDPSLIKLVDYVLYGECSICQPSTVIDCSIKPWKILRQGAVKISNIKYQISNIPKKTIVLKIDTSSNQVIEVGLRVDSKGYWKRKKLGAQKAQAVLPMIEEVLKKHNLELKDLEGIEVNTGPGSFTGLRVGAAVANALSFALKIPVNNKSTGVFVEPVY